MHLYRSSSCETPKLCDPPPAAGGPAIFRLQKSVAEWQDYATTFATIAMLLGYARVSTDDQDLALQRAALRACGCRRVYEEKLSGARRDRPELVRLLDTIREQDIVVVTRLDRLPRSTRDPLDIAQHPRGA